jgi:two-component system nitrogen regulation response regulator NtrX
MPYRLLVVDDDDAARTSLHSLVLATLPETEIDVAANAAEGITQIQRHSPYHVVLSDMRMPEGTEGLQVVSAAREKDVTTEIIVLTAYGDMENVYQALKLGANQYIDKNLPDTVNTQITAIENAAGRAERARRNARRLQAMERLAQEIERREPALTDVTETLHLLVDYAREIAREDGAGG